MLERWHSFIFPVNLCHQFSSRFALYQSYVLCKQIRSLLGDLTGMTDPIYAGSIALALGCIHRRLVVKWSSSFLNSLLSFDFFPFYFASSKPLELWTIHQELSTFFSPMHFPLPSVQEGWLCQHWLRQLWIQFQCCLGVQLPVCRHGLCMDFFWLLKLLACPMYPKFRSSTYDLNIFKIWNFHFGYILSVLWLFPLYWSPSKILYFFWALFFFSLFFCCLLTFHLGNKKRPTL